MKKLLILIFVLLYSSTALAEDIRTIFPSINGFVIGLSMEQNRDICGYHTNSTWEQLPDYYGYPGHFYRCIAETKKPKYHIEAVFYTIRGVVVNIRLLTSNKKLCEVVAVELEAYETCKENKETWMYCSKWWMVNCEIIKDKKGKSKVLLDIASALKYSDFI